MTHFINLEHKQPKHKQKFEEFIFIGNLSNKSVANATKQLNLSPNSELISQACVEDSLLITKVHTAKNICHQLKDLRIEPGVIVKLVSKTNNGSVVVSLGNKLIGIGAEIAGKIVTIPAS